MLYIGTAGWSYEDWKGIVYPDPPPRGFDALTYLSEYFNCVEVNTTFYRPPNPAMVSNWVKKVRGNEEFSFSVKLWQRFTHEKAREWGEADVELFKTAISPLLAGGVIGNGPTDATPKKRRGEEVLRQAELFSSGEQGRGDEPGSRGRLGALLIQFPWSFRDVQESREYLETLSRTFAEYPKVVEVRHISWDTPEALEFVREHELNFCNIDQPQMKSCIKTTAHVTGEIAYVRLHGRNYENWFKSDAGRDARYDYLYGEAEMDEWVERIRGLMEEAANVFVIANNHFRGQAPANALALKAKLTGKKVSVPESLVAHYPFLRKYASNQ